MRRNTFTMILLCLLAVGTLVYYFTDIGLRVSKDNYLRIELGMNRKQIESMLGRGEDGVFGSHSTPGLLRNSGFSLDSNRLTPRKVQWRDRRREIIITFVGEKAVEKEFKGPQKEVDFIESQKGKGACRVSMLDAATQPATTQSTQPATTQSTQPAITRSTQPATAPSTQPATQATQPLAPSTRPSPDKAPANEPRP